MEVNAEGRRDLRQRGMKDGWRIIKRKHDVCERESTRASWEINSVTSGVCLSLITMETLSVFSVFLWMNLQHMELNHFSASQNTGFKFLLVWFVTRFPDVARLEDNTE